MVEDAQHNQAWQAMAKELQEVLVLLRNFHVHKDRDVSSETLHQGLKEYHFSEEGDPYHLKIRVQNFTRMDLHLFTLVFRQWQRRRGTS
ncbi:MAG TPA: hypothetical protein DD706_14795 [Nitrospiraceae bacterium]|nr:hypothetical protein [Nitrospiraceae bacterium]